MLLDFNACTIYILEQQHFCTSQRYESWMVGDNVQNPGYAFTSPVSFIPAFE